MDLKCYKNFPLRFKLYNISNVPTYLTDGGFYKKCLLKTQCFYLKIYFIAKYLVEK